MPDGELDLSVEVVERLADVPDADWDACAGPENPFIGHAFLNLLEESGAAAPGAGWAARHLVVRDAGGALLGCAPAYLKSHSMGEYVFDWNWAEAYERAGGTYYPKLLCAVPFTPATGPRLMARGDLDAACKARVKRALAGGLAALTERAGLSSAHVNFHPQSEGDVLGEAGFLPRTGIQYHWKNNNYQCFDDFLGELTSRKRKAIRRERKAVAAVPGLTIERLTGAAIGAKHLDAMYAFYQDTGARKWGQPYLNRETFRLLGARMAQHLLLVLAKRDGRTIAGALNLIGVNALYGRYWGCLEDIPFLHFELSYYQAIEAAIEMGLARVEAGAQGEHKIARGYRPTLTHSSHFVTDPGFRDAVGQFLTAESRAIAHELNALDEESPFRTSPDAG